MTITIAPTHVNFSSPVQNLQHRMGIAQFCAASKAGETHEMAYLINDWRNQALNGPFETDIGNFLAKLAWCQLRGLQNFI
jgi:hypothetical protein